MLKFKGIGSVYIIRKIKLSYYKAMRIRNYLDLNDISLFRSTKDQAVRDHIYRKIVKRYSKLIVREVKNIQVNGYEFKDLMQEALIVLFKLIHNQYRTDLKSPFWHFLRMCIKRRLYSLISAAKSQRNSALNSSCELDKGLFPVDIGRLSPMPWVSSHENHIIDKMIAKLVIRQMKSALTDLEYKAYLEKNAFMLTYQQISDKYGYHTKQIDNALRRAHKKVQQILVEIANDKMIAG